MINTGSQFVLTTQFFILLHHLDLKWLFFDTNDFLKQLDRNFFYLDFFIIIIYFIEEVKYKY